MCICKVLVALLKSLSWASVSCVYTCTLSFRSNDLIQHSLNALFLFTKTAGPELCERAVIVWPRVTAHLPTASAKLCDHKPLWVLLSEHLLLAPKRSMMSGSGWPFWWGPAHPRPPPESHWQHRQAAKPPFPYF